MAGEFRTISVALVLNGQQFEAKLRAQSTELRTFEEQATRSGKGAAAGLDKTSKSADSMGFSVKSALSNFVAFTGAQITVEALGAAFRALGGEAVQFDANMRNVNSLAHLSEAQLAALSSQVLGLAKSGDFLQSATDMSAGLYDLVSSGFGPANGGLQVLQASLTSASAGMTDTATAVRGTAAVLNAYGEGADQAEHVSNVLFGTVNKGVITYEELAGQIGDVVGIAAAAKVPIEDVGSAIATMTLSGISGAEATTSLNRVIQSIINPSDQMATVLHQVGYESGAQALQADGLRGVMEKLRTATGGQVEQLIQLFPEIRAARGAFALMSADGRTYAQVSQYMTTVDRDQGEAKRALAEQMKGLGAQATVAWHQFQAGAIDAANKALPYVKEGLRDVESIASTVWGVLVDGFDRAEPTLVALAGAIGDVWSGLVSVGEAAAPMVQLLAGAGFVGALGILQGLAAVLSVIGGFLQDNASLVSALIAVWVGFKTVELVVAGATAAVRIFDMASVALFDKLGSGINFSTFAMDAEKAEGATTGLASSLSGLNVATGVAMGALAAITVAFDIAATNASHAKEATDKFISGLKIDESDPRSVNNGIQSIVSEIDRLQKKAGGSDFEQWKQNINPWDDNTISTTRKRIQDLYGELDRLNAKEKAELGNTATISHYTGASLDEVVAKANELKIPLDKAFANTPERGQLIAALKDVSREAREAGISHQQMATMDADALQAAIDQWNKYRDSVQGALQKSMDVISGTKDLIGPDVLAKRLTDMAGAQKDLDTALYDQARAQDRINQSTPDNPVTPDDLQQLADANDKVTTARQKLSDATSKANTSDIDSIRNWYQQTLSTTQQFSDNISKAIQEGYDPGLISRILQAGPEQAGPFLAAIVSDQGQVYKNEINRAEQAITEMQAKVVAQARLVNKATQSPTDALVNDLPKASEIQLRLSSTQGISREQIAAQMGITVQEVQRIADEYGITLPVIPTVPPGTPPPDVPPVPLDLTMPDVQAKARDVGLKLSDFFQKAPPAVKVAMDIGDPLTKAAIVQDKLQRLAASDPTVKAFMDALDPQQKTFMINAWANQIDATKPNMDITAKAYVDEAERALDFLGRDRHVTFTADVSAIAAGNKILDIMSLLAGAARQQAIDSYVGGNRWGGVWGPDGSGMVRHFAQGGMFPQIGERGVTRVWNEPATGQEAYVPQYGDYLRAMTTLQTAAGWYGADVIDRKKLTHFAAGGVMMPVTGGVMGSFGHLAPVVPPSFRPTTGGGTTIVDQSTIRVDLGNAPAGMTAAETKQLVRTAVKEALDDRERHGYQRTGGRR